MSNRPPGYWDNWPSARRKRRIHIRDPDDPWRSLCGLMPARSRRLPFAETRDQVTCQRCLARPPAPAGTPKPKPARGVATAGVSVRCT